MALKSDKRAQQIQVEKLIYGLKFKEAQNENRSDVIIRARHAHLLRERADSAADSITNKSEWIV